jgi:hypothetical protein
VLNFALYRSEPWSILQVTDGGYHLMVVLVAGLSGDYGVCGRGVSCVHRC